MQVFQCFRWFFDCLQRPIRTAFETLPFIRYVCLLTGSQRELEHDGKRKTGSWKWESICRITFIDFKRNGAECIRLGDRQLTYAMQYSHLRVSFLNGIVYWSIDDDDDALLFQELFFFFFLWKMLGSLETEKVWNARGSVWKLTKNLIYYWSGRLFRCAFYHYIYRQNRASSIPGATSQLITMATMVPACPPLLIPLQAKGFV